MAEKELRIKYVGDASGLSRTLSGIDRMHSSLGSRVKSLAGSIGRGLLSIGKAAGVGLAAIGGFAIKAAGEAQQVGAQTEAVLESTGGAAGVTAKQVNDLATSIQGYSGISDEAIASGSNLLLTFTRIRNEAGKGNDVFDQATRIATDMSVALGTDVKQAAMQVGKALNDPVRGMAALRRVGVSFTTAQEKQVAAMVEAGDTMGAQKLILAELTKEFGGSAKAVGQTFPGQLNIAKETVGNALEEIGGTIITKLGPILPTITKALVGVVNTVGPVLGQLLGVLSSTLSQVLPILAPVIKMIGGQLALAFKKVAPLLRQLLPPLGQLLAAIAPLVPLGVELIVQVLKPLLPVIRFVITKAIVPLVNAFAGLVRFIASKVGPVIRTLVSVFTTAFGKIKDFLIGVWNTIKGALAAVVNVILGILEGIINAGIKAYNFVANLPLNPMDPVAPIRLPRLARGSRSFAGGPALLGEHGPELAMLPAGTRVFGAGRSRQMMDDAGGGGITVVVNVAGSVAAERDLAETIRRELVRIGRRNGGASALGLG